MTGCATPHKSHNALVIYPTMHHFVTERWTCVHISVTEWFIVGYCDILWVCEMGILDESLCCPYIDVKWTSWHLQSPEIRLFVQLLLHIKHESSAALVLCWRNLRVTRRFSTQRAGNGGSVSMSWRDQAMSHWGILTHWGRDKMAASFLTFSNAFFWLKML